MFDPRLAQIAVLASLSLLGACALDLEIRPAVAVSAVVAALSTEAITARLRHRVFDPRSPLISGLSLTLLLRVSDAWLGAVAGIIAIASKSLLRVGDKHWFNPTNFALVVLLLVTDRAWVSSGQWGSTPIIAAAMVGGGTWVLRNARGDVTIAFLATHTALLIGRALWLGDPLAIPLHQLQSGSLLIFALFMISDPRTVPDRRAGRIGFAIAVALLGYWLRFGLHEPNALLYALAATSPLSPLIDRWLPGTRFAWSRRTRSPETQETPHVLDPSHDQPIGVALAATRRG